MLRQDNDKLRAENMSLRKSMGKNDNCKHCNNLPMISEINLEQQQLRIENSRLKEELNRVCSLSINYSSHPIFQNNSTTTTPEDPHPPHHHASSLTTPPMSSPPGAQPFISWQRFRSCPDMLTSSFQVMDPITHRSMHKRSMYFELGMAAVEELVKLVQAETPLWIQLDDFTETLNFEEYGVAFPRLIGPKPTGFVSEATRASSTVMISSTILVETLMDVVS